MSAIESMTVADVEAAALRLFRERHSATPQPRHRIALALDECQQTKRLLIKLGML